MTTSLGDPIDADFEPVPENTSGGPVISRRRGPGWIAFLGLGLISLASLATAIWSLGLIPGSGQVPPDYGRLKTSLAALSESSAQQETEMERLKSEVQGVSDLQARTTDIAERLRLLESQPIRAEMSGMEPEALIGIEGFEARISSLEDTITANSGTTTGEATNPVDLERLEQDIEALQQRVATLEQNRSSAERAAEMAQTEKTSAAALALASIEAAARRGEPFLKAQQDLMEALPGNRAAIQLQSLASTPIPTRSDLAGTFSVLSDAGKDRAAREDGEGAKWMRTLFGDGNKVRREGVVSAADLIDQAEQALKQSDLDTAIERVEALSAPVQSVFTDWLNNARKRQTLERSLESLRLTMISKDRP